MNLLLKAGLPHCRKQAGRAARLRLAFEEAPIRELICRPKKRLPFGSRMLRSLPLIQLCFWAGLETHNYLWTTPKTKLPDAQVREKYFKYVWLGFSN
jgi:hypothetical protein